jgi:hypothetical protein
MHRLCRHVDGDRRHPYFQMMMAELIHLDHHLTELRPLDGMANHLGALRRRLHLEHLFLDVLQSLDVLNLDALLPFLVGCLLVLDAHLDAMVAVLVGVALVDVESHR